MRDGHRGNKVQVVDKAPKDMKIRNQEQGDDTCRQYKMIVCQAWVQLAGCECGRKLDKS